MSARPVDLVLFDAVGTLIEPMPSAGEVYSDCARRFDCESDDCDYQIRLISAMHNVAITMRHDRDGQTDEPFEYECWRQVVRNAFDERSHDQTDQMFVELWNHFATAGNWKLFPDVAPTIAELKRRGYRMGIASNFDGRLLGICRELPPLDTLDPIFVSSQVGWSKPSDNFYAEIERATQLKPERIFMVGDDCYADKLAPEGRGWQSCWLGRNAESSQQGKWIRSLTEVLDLLPG